MLLLVVTKITQFIAAWELENEMFLYLSFVTSEKLGMSFYVSARTGT